MTHGGWVAWLRRETVWLPLIIVVAGPAVLALMWVGLDWPSDVDGFPAFRSGTVGDAVLLPAIAGALVKISALCPPAHNEQRWSLTLAVIGSAVGITVQWTWWSDPTPPTQWGITAPRDFSIAGWWHAGFFVIMAGLLAALAIRMLLRIRAALTAGDTSTLRTPAFTLLITAMASFCGLLVLDAHPTSASNSSRASLIALTLAVVVLIALSAALWRHHTARAAITVATGLLGAMIAVVACLAWPPAIWQLFVFVLAVFAPAIAMKRYAPQHFEKKQKQG